ncbi:hypothetical protein [Microbacterium rhizophilus]|uniref:hypothetical protein n=1 Tax=Microbacterium rhizophilus TaxID=3138934 RepID=UPI0031EE6599
MARSRNPLSPETLLDIHLSAICERHRWDADPGPAIEELRREAGDRLDILADAAGRWAGYCEQDRHAQPLVTAIKAMDLPGLDEAVRLGRYRAGQGVHGASFGHHPRSPGESSSGRSTAS